MGVYGAVVGAVVVVVVVVVPLPPMQVHLVVVLILQGQVHRGIWVEVVHTEARRARMEQVGAVCILPRTLPPHPTSHPPTQHPLTQHHPH